MRAVRGLLVVLGTVSAIVAPMARATDTRSPHPIRIGALTDSWGPTPAIVGLRDGLRGLGYREDVDFVIGVRFTQGDPARLPEAAQALVRQGVDLLVASTDAGARAAQRATARIPIVFVLGSDPVGAGLVKSFARPGGNITGVADLELELVPKRMEIFRELIPDLKRVLLAYDATRPDAVSRLAVHRDAARRLGLALVERPVRSEDEARAVIGATSKAEVDGIFSPRLVSLNIPGVILEVAVEQAIPTMFDDTFYVERGALASYGAPMYELGRQAARLVAKILEGARPSDVPVEQPTQFELAINLEAARTLDITIPRSILLRATRVIE